ncbi:MAG: NAD-dependent epimerase/dehydratase family protein [Steroidobacteraceae bacterium]
MRILVVGGTRFIGPRVVRRLVGAGHTVAVFHRGQHEIALPAAVQRIKDPRAGMPIVAFSEETRRFNPEVVLHMVAIGEADAEAARQEFAGRVRRMVMVSSGDVYRAYGLFKRLEEGAVDNRPLTESSPLRTSRFPYRHADTPKDALEYEYDKVLAERALAADSRLPVAILRLPKVYGIEDNGDLATVYGFRDHPEWRWTHGYVENVADAIALAVVTERAAGRTYNVGEEPTPSVAERLKYLPARAPAAQLLSEANFDQNIVYDTSRIRGELSYGEGIPERDAMVRVAAAYLEADTAS